MLANCIPNVCSSYSVIYAAPIPNPTGAIRDCRVEHMYGQAHIYIIHICTYVLYVYVHMYYTYMCKYCRL